MSTQTEIPSHVDDLMNNLGIGSTEDATNDVSDDNASDGNTDENQDGLNNSDNEPTNNDGEEVKADNNETGDKLDTEKLKVMEEEMEVYRKRITDKDKYINELREESKKTEETKTVDTQDNSEVEDDEDFWSNPEKTVQDLRNELAQQKETARVQNLQMQEVHYANTVDDYWATVNGELLKEAVSVDTEFADKFNKSNEPYKVAYEYLKEQSKVKATKADAYKEQVRQEILKEMNVKEKKEIPPNVNIGSKPSDTGSKADSDGFASIFGSQH